MRSFLVIAAIVGLVAGDVSHLQGQSGYHYKVPQTSYGVPSYQVNTPSYSTTYKGYQQTQQGAGQGYQQAQQSAGQGYQVQQGANHGYQQAQQATGFGQQGASHGHQSGSHYQTGSSAGYNNANQYQTSGVGVAQAPTSNQYLVGQQGNQYQSGSQYESSLVQKYQEFYRQQQQQPAQVYKHFYVHAAPEEPEQPKFRQTVALPPPQKHYKIIFIKTPAQHAPAPQLVPIQQQNEEKTIVYVLVQKPEEARNVVVPQIEQKPPAKPEVFFIKYQGKEGSQAVINNIVNDYNKGEAASVQYTGLENAGASTGSVQYTGLENAGVSTGSVQYTGVENSGASTGSVQYTGVENTGASAVSEASSAFAQSSVGQAVQEEQSHHAHQVPQYFGSEGIKTATAEAVSTGYGVAESSAVAQGGSTSSEAQNQEGFLNTISTSQGVPHESYGIPKFRAN